VHNQPINTILTGAFASQPPFNPQRALHLRRRHLDIRFLFGFRRLAPGVMVPLEALN
jgi:hypothetical protein